MHYGDLVARASSPCLCVAGIRHSSEKRDSRSKNVIARSPSAPLRFAQDRLRDEAISVRKGCAADA